MTVIQLLNRRPSYPQTALKGNVEMDPHSLGRVNNQGEGQVLDKRPHTAVHHNTIGSSL